MQHIYITIPNLIGAISTYRYENYKQAITQPTYQSLRPGTDTTHTPSSTRRLTILISKQSQWVIAYILRGNEIDHEATQISGSCQTTNNRKERTYNTKLKYIYTTQQHANKDFFSQPIGEDGCLQYKPLFLPQGSKVQPNLLLITITNSLYIEALIFPIAA